MAGAPPATLSRKLTVTLMNTLIQLILKQAVHDIRRLLESLQPEQCRQILNCSKNNYTLLSFAIEKRKFTIAHYLLDLALRQGTRQLCSAWQKTHHPLNAALIVNNTRLVRLITQHLCDINAYAHGPYTPLMLAIHSGVFEHVRHMVRKGADVNLSNGRNGTTPLMMSVFSTRISRFLIKKGATLDSQDQNGDTALHKAVVGEFTLSIRIIVEAGANLMIRNNEGLTPLMLAVRELDVPIIAYLSSMDIYSPLDMIESAEVLNACYVCEGHRMIINWVRTLRYRRFMFPRNSPYEPQAVLDFSQEFATEEELQLVQNDDLKLAFQGILVIERILGRGGKTYLQSLLYTAWLAKQVSNIDKLKQLISYIHEVCQGLPPEIVCSASKVFSLLFDSFLYDNDPENFYKNGGFEIFQMISLATENMWTLIKVELLRTPVMINASYTILINKLLYMVSHISDMNLPRDYLVQFYKTLVYLLKKDPRDEHHQSLLHSAIKLYNTATWATKDLIRVLLESGADVNAKDHLRRTPLIYAIQFLTQNDAREIGELLLKFGAHLDCKTSEGFSLFDYPRWKRLSLVPRNPRSLQCIAVEVILDNQIDYKGILHKFLNEFISLHI